jgi:hypothetical protein
MLKATFMSYSHDAAICTLVDCPLSVREGEWDFDCGDRTDAPFVTRLMRLCGPEHCTPYKGDDLKVRMKERRDLLRCDKKDFPHAVFSSMPLSDPFVLPRRHLEKLLNGYRIELGVKARKIKYATLLTSSSRISEPSFRKSRHSNSMLTNMPT